MNSKPGRAPVPASQVTRAWPQTAANDPLIHVVLAGFEQSLLFVQSAITTPVLAVWTETAAVLIPLHGIRLWPFSVVKLPGRSCALPSTTLSDSRTNSAAAARGWTSSTASGSAPPSVLSSKTDTRACALIDGTTPRKKESHGRLFSVALTST